MTKLDKIREAMAGYYARHEQVSEDLIEAVFYSVDGGGKRIRPLILLDLLEGFGIRLTPAHYDVAASLEMIHTGSLIHDDLPAMDNDDYRRGRLTSHKQFDEATAILAGDSLFLDPFGLLAEAELPDHIKVALLAKLSQAAGGFGMVAGQMLDMKGEQQDLTLSQLETIHVNKTGRLLAFPFWAAGLMAGLSEADMSLLEKAGQLVGLAFQVRDDILDVTASFEELGKTPNKDLVADKSTYPSLLGLEASYDMLEQTLQEALAIFQKLEEEEGFDLSESKKLIERLRLHG